MYRGWDPEDDEYYSICSEKCARLMSLDWVDVGDSVIYPRSCEHCWRCGQIIKGTYEHGCAIHSEPEDMRKILCPLLDPTCMSRFETTMDILKDTNELTDKVWKYAIDVIGTYSDAPPGAIAELLMNMPELFD